MEHQIKVSLEPNDVRLRALNHMTLPSPGSLYQTRESVRTNLLCFHLFFSFPPTVTRQYSKHSERLSKPVRQLKNWNMKQRASCQPLDPYLVMLIQFIHRFMSLKTPGYIDH